MAVQCGRAQRLNAVTLICHSLDPILPSKLTYHRPVPSFILFSSPVQCDVTGEQFPEINIFRQDE